MAKTKVLRIISRLNIGGVSIHCTMLSKYLPQDKYESLLIHGSLSESEGDMSYNLKDEPLLFIPELQRELNLKKDITAFLAICRCIRRFKPDIIHTHTAKAGILGRLAGKLMGVKTIIHTFHGNVFQGYFSPRKTQFFINLEKMLALCSTKIIAISQLQKEELLNFKITKESKLEIVKLGFDFSNVIPEKSYKTDFRKRFNIEENDILVGIVGRLAPIKNHEMFVDIAEIVLKSIKTNIKFVIIGDGEVKQNIEAYIKEKGLQEYFIFTGFTNNLKEIYSEIDYITLTSKNEGTPVAIIEAMANKKLIFSTNVGGISDFVDNNKTGYYFGKDDVIGFAAKLTEVIKHHNTDRYNKIKEDASKVAIEQFSYKRLVKDIDELYSKLITRGKK